MKIALVQPKIDEKYGDRQGYASTRTPPETGLAVLSTYLRTYASEHDVVCIDPVKTDDVLSEQMSGFDLAGFTDWFSNHRRVVSLARQVKTLNPSTRVVIGGPNTSGIAQLILEKYPFVDYVVERDGEDALLGIVNELPLSQIPNLWYRHDGKAKFTQSGFVDLNRSSLWDFLSFENLDSRLAEYRETVAQSWEKDFDPWLVPPLAMSSFRGCMKAARSGVCSYCTSAETIVRALAPDKFWAQLEVLKDRYGAGPVYMTDDIFPVSVTRMERLARAKPPCSMPMIRAYAYMPDFIGLDARKMERMVGALHTIGAFNLFFGIENFGIEQITRANKAAVSVEDCKRVIESLGRAGIKTTMAYLLGLPGETEESLSKNLSSLEVLLATGYVERVYMSVVMSLRGTPMFDELCRNSAVAKGYKQSTGKALVTDDDPDYALLQRLSVELLTGLDPDEVNDWMRKMVAKAEQHLPPHKIGAFMLEI